MESSAVCMSTSSNSENVLTEAKSQQIASKSTNKDVLNQYETPETKSLSNEQLQRFVLLQQVKVLGLKRMKLEHDLQIRGVTEAEGADKVEFEYINWDPSNNVDSTE